LLFKIGGNLVTHGIEIALDPRFVLLVELLHVCIRRAAHLVSNLFADDLFGRDVAALRFGDQQQVVDLQVEHALLRLINVQLQLVDVRLDALVEHPGGERAACDCG
jgi:hypothetical protein